MSDNNVTKATTVTGRKEVDKVDGVDNNSSDVEIIKIAETETEKSKSCSLVADHSDESVSIPDASMAEDEQESELDVSCVSNDELGKTLPGKASTPRQEDRGKKRSEKSKETKEVITKLFHLF